MGYVLLQMPCQADNPGLLICSGFCLQDCIGAMEQAEQRATAVYTQWVASFQHSQMKPIHCLFQLKPACLFTSMHKHPLLALCCLLSAHKV